MSSVNMVMLLGNLGRDPEVRNFQGGGKVCNLRVATSDKWKDRNTGEDRQKTEWHSVAIFGPLADVAERYLRKGSKVSLIGKLVTRKWQDQSGQDRYSTEVTLQGPEAKLVMLGHPDGDGSGGGYGGSGAGGSAGNSGATGGGGMGGSSNHNIDDDEIPF